METLSADDYAWAKRCGLTDERIAFLLACPKYTRSVGYMTYKREVNPNHHLQKLGDCWWFRLRRRGLDIVENIGHDLETARRRRDEMLEAYNTGKPIPYLNAR